MKTLVFQLSFLFFSAFSTSGQSPLHGTWEGSIGGVRTVVHFMQDEDGELAGTVDNPAQGAFGLGLVDVVVTSTAKEGAAKGSTISFRVPETHGAWKGRLDEESGKLVGIWKQRGAELTVDFEQVQVDPLVGTWQGVGDFGTLQLRIVFHVGMHADGSFGANMVSPDQSSTRVAVASVEIRDDGMVVFDVAQVGALYEGLPDAECKRIVGHLNQGGGKYSLDLERVGRVAAVRRPQTPEPPFPYRVEEVEYANEAVGNRLAGTLTLPTGGGPFPAVLLITGSGQQDRNEEIFNHKPFLVIADHLTRAGVAVLRVDDRGVGGSTGEVATATSRDFASDVRAGLDFLGGRGDVRADAIGLLGHSEGGLIAPLVAVEREDVAFLVLLAGPGTRGDVLLFKQAELLARAGGAGDVVVEVNRARQEQLFEVLRTEKDSRELRKKLRAILVSSGGEAALAQLEQVASPWFQFFVNHDPAPTLRKVTCPVLALNGEQDLQVPAEENLAAIAAALEAGGNTDFEIKAYPRLNHLFQHCESGAISEYGEIEETISSEVLEDIAAWVGARVRAE